MQLPADSDPQVIIDKHFTITGPRRQVRTGITAASTPRFELVRRLGLQRVGFAIAVTPAMRLFP